MATLRNDMAAYYSVHGTYEADDIRDETNVHLYTFTYSVDCYHLASNITTILLVQSKYQYCVEKTGGGLEPLFTIDPVDVHGIVVYSENVVTGNIGTAVKQTSAYTELVKDMKSGGNRVRY